jgi:hypothetical protein
VQAVPVSVAVLALAEQLLGQGEDERGEQIVRERLAVLAEGLRKRRQRFKTQAVVHLESQAEVSNVVQVLLHLESSPMGGGCRAWASAFPDRSRAPTYRRPSTK